MRKLQAPRHEVDAKALVLAAPTDDHFDEVVRDDVDVYEGDALRIVYRKYAGDDVEAVSHLARIRFSNEHRTEGLTTRSRVFGFQPRNALRNDFCALATLAKESPDAHNFVLRMGAELSSIYAATNPATYGHQAALVEKVLPEWRIPGAVYTSGIINQNNSLGYHFDSGNFKGCWSAMVVFSNRLRGGHLAVPALRLAFSFERPAVIFFDGQSLLHGVTKIEVPRGVGYRYSIVYYSLQQMCKCLPMAEEVERSKQIRTVREKRRLLYGKVPGLTPHNIEKYERDQKK